MMHAKHIYQAFVVGFLMVQLYSRDILGGPNCLPPGNRHIPFSNIRLILSKGRAMKRSEADLPRVGMEIPQGQKIGGRLEVGITWMVDFLW